MILIPEIETVVLLVPRTGSGTLRRAIAERYPRSILLYRHMEADGVPAGYDRWPRVGVVRKPLDRLWSLYKFLSVFGGDHHPAYIAAMRQQVDRPFEDWLLHNETVFTSPYDSAGSLHYWPNYTVRHSLPENRKSQFLYLRPDLGTHVVRFDDLREVALALGVELQHRHNVTVDAPPPRLGHEAREHMERVFDWDIGRAGGMGGVE